LPSSTQLFIWAGIKSDGRLAAVFIVLPWVINANVLRAIQRLIFS